MNVHTLHWQGGWARVGPWRSHATVGQVTVGAATPPTPQIVERCVELLRSGGYVAAVTSALSPVDSLPFVDAGFAVRERLHLLAHDLDSIPNSSCPTRRATRRDRPAVLDVDGRAFDGFWKLDARALDDARRATPTARFRVVGARGAEELDGYAITGCAGAHGYVQRVAVHPGQRRRGVGRGLLHDSLTWLARRGVRRALVNTQFRNDAALSLYEACGFRRMPVGLCVLGTAL